MAISQYPTNKTSGVTPFAFFSTNLHMVPFKTPWEYEDQRERFFGVRGEQEVCDQVHGRWIRLETHFMGFGSLALIDAATNVLDSQINALKGPLGISGEVYLNCTFKGFEPFAPPQRFYGTHPGWGVMGTLVWRQLKP